MLNLMNEYRALRIGHIARSLVEAQRDVHPSRVFTYRDRPVGICITPHGSGRV